MVVMPPKRVHSGEGTKSRKRRRMPPKGTQEYQEKRERNNESVRKCRENNRSKARLTVDRVSHLKEENRMLEQQVEILSKELTILKDLFKMVHADSSTCPLTNVQIQTEDTQSEIKQEVVMEINPENLTNSQPQSSPVLADVKIAQEALKKDHEYSKGAMKKEY